MSAKDSVILDALAGCSVTYETERAALTRAAAIARALESGEWKLLPYQPYLEMLEATMRKGTANEKRSLSCGSYQALWDACPTFTEDRGERVGGDGDHG